MDYIELHKFHKENSLFGRYITLNDIEPLLSKLKAGKIGESVLGQSIYKYQAGTGATRVYMWSQMHGNESTTTKALFDFFNLIHSKEPIGEMLLKAFTFCFLPMVNPDGAKAYTRENANAVDLNRDSCSLSQPESQLLRKVFDEFQPHYCFNLHDQRTLFGAGDTGKVATVSFLSPSFNEARDIDETRLKAMQVIVAMNEELQHHIPGQVGRFDDSFNINCIGDTFQQLKVPTVLFEAGHYENDYYREFTRKMLFIALVAGLKGIMDNKAISNEIEYYLKIPQNKINFYDFIYRNVKINYDGKEIITNFAAQYREELIDGKIQFNAYIAEIGELKGFYAHYQLNAHKMLYADDAASVPAIGQKATFTLGGSYRIVNGMKA